MKVAYFDTVAGVSGDMTLGAFISAGMPVEVIREMISRLGLSEIEIQPSHISRNGMTAVKLDVIINSQQKGHRHLRDIVAMIEESNLNDRVKENALKIFNEIGRAEAKIHNMPMEKIHFHEVGALDSILDIVGAALCFDYMGIEKVFSSPVKLGSGALVKTDHGLLPVPGPAAMEILKGYPTVMTDIPFELTTPTGAGIIKAMSSGVLSYEHIIAEAIGYGAGTREMKEVPNVLRVIIGSMESEYEQDEIVSVETNIDDMNPEIYPFLFEQLFSHGAHDAYLVPVIMKKGRPGTLLSILCGRQKLDEILGIVFAQTTTIGVRIQPVERKKLPREEVVVKTKFGEVKVKKITRNGRETLIPEYEECKRLALDRKMTIVDVYQALQKELC